MQARRLNATLIGVTCAVALGGLALARLAGQPSAQADPAARMARIEQGLLPAVRITNGEPIKYSIADRMKNYKVPAVSIAFVDNGQIAWAKAYGVADVASNRTATTDTLFQAASISKPVAALAVLRLVQDGKLALDEDVNTKLRSWKVPDNEFTAKEKVTLRRLLSHTAGMTVSGFPGYATTDPVPTTLQVLNGEKPANTRPIRVDVEPGTVSRYSGGGFTVMQVLVNDMTGKTFANAMREMVLEPAGMLASTYEQPLPSQLASRATAAYLRSGEPVAGGPHIYPEMAAAGLWTTPSDLARLAIEIEATLDGRSSRILSQASMREMTRMQRDDYGLGIGVTGEGPSFRLGHNGANAGYRASWVHYPNRRQGVVMMTNSDAGAELMGEVMRAVSAEYGWPDFKPVERTLAKIDAAALAAYAGTYRADENRTATVTVENGRLLFQAPPFGPKPVELLPQSQTDFFMLTNPIIVHFSPDGDSVSVSQGPNKLSFTRVRQ